MLKVIRESIKAVPAMKYALAIAGLLAVVALAGAFRLSPQMAVLGTVVTLVLMVAMVVFARLTTTAPRHFFLPVQVMMWAFLVVTVGTAFLLFTSAFFQWPRALRELFDARATPAVTATTPPDNGEVGALIESAQQQLKARDHAGAWATITRATTLNPKSAAARDEQTQIAMAWIRDMSKVTNEEFGRVVRPLTDALYLHAVSAKGSLAADIHAHLGWANFLRWKLGAGQLNPEQNYVTAVSHDATNPFAHAFWGHWIAVQGGGIAEISRHFALALESGRERAFVQEYRIVALQWSETPDTTTEVLRVADEMRRGGDALSPGRRSNICSAVYWRLGRKAETTVLSVLPPTDHLLTFRWLVDGRKLEDYTLLYWQARLTEAAGDFDSAALQYRTLLKQDISERDRVQAGLDRCEQRRVTRTRG